MSSDELVLTCMLEEGDEFEKNVFELLFGIDARPAETVGEYHESPPRVFTYQEAQEALAEVSKSLQLLQMIKEHFACPYQEDEDTEENLEMRELIDQLAREIDNE